MTAEQRQLDLAIGAVLKPRGFTKRKSSWYYVTDDCVGLLNVQKSNFGSRIYVNLGVSVKAIMSTDFPQEHQCNIVSRLSELVADRQAFEEACNFEDTGVSPDKLKHIIAAIETVGVPFLEQLGTVDGIRKRLAKGEPYHFLITVQLSRWLERSSP
ncbi:MAG: hypothetical protein QOJ45_285 [Verrucomicrobiota bacterium]